VNLLDPVHTLVERAVDGRSNSERATNDSAQTDEETRESLVTDFAVDDLHWRDVLD
jgi:hypothetical protein